MTGSDRIVAHVDMDAFFASCEELRHPEFRGKPLVVGAVPGPGPARGVVVAANYEARRFGIRSAMPIREAWRRNPHAKYVWPDHTFYMSVGRRVFEALGKEFESNRVSIDEAFIEAGTVTTWEEATAFAGRIRDCVAAASGGLSCSVGIGPNRLVAKIATDFRKPSGTTIVPPRDVQAFLDPLPVGRIPGVGPKTQERLAALGLHTVADLRSKGRTLLSSGVGAHGAYVLDAAEGRDAYHEHHAHERSRSRSEERTFMEDVRDRHKLVACLRRMVSSLEEDLSRAGDWYRTVAVKVRYADFETHTRQASLARPVADTTPARTILPDLLDAFLTDPRPVRLLGVRFGDLVCAAGQRTLAQFA